MLFTLTSDDLNIYHEYGRAPFSLKKMGIPLGSDFMNLSKEAPDLHEKVTFVRPYSCGLFKDETKPAELALEALESGRLTKCEHGKESAVDAEAAFVVASDKWKDGKWSIDATDASHGIAFASIVCAVFASVSLVLVVLL